MIIDTSGGSMTRSLAVAVAILVFATSTFSQFGQSNRLTDFAARLSRDAREFADTSYNNYTNSSRNNRTDIEAVLLTQHFAASSQTFYRMVADRRRNQELRDAFYFLSSLASSVERHYSQRNNWSNIRRLMSDISRELDYDSGGGQSPPDTGRGRMTWKGRVDDDVRIRIRGGTAEVETIGGSPYSDAQPNFYASLPYRRVNVQLTVKKGRGQVFIEQQPSRENDFTAVIRIKDPKGGSSDYEFELSW
jgi:hypothetical protein